MKKAKAATEVNIRNDADAGPSAKFASDVRAIIVHGIQDASRAVHSAALVTYWRVGCRIVEEEQAGAKRAWYGQNLLANLSRDLQLDYGESYSERNLRNYRQFFLMFPDFEIWNACVPNLTWTHFREVRMFYDLNRTEGDNPTIGLLLCADTSKDIAKYSVLHGSKQLFAAKYMTFLPTEEELRREIERQKEIFAAQHELGNRIMTGQKNTEEN